MLSRPLFDVLLRLASQHHLFILFAYFACFVESHIALRTHQFIFFISNVIRSFSNVVCSFVVDRLIARPAATSCNLSSVTSPTFFFPLLGCFCVCVLCLVAFVSVCMRPGLHFLLSLAPLAICCLVSLQLVACRSLRRNLVLLPPSLFSHAPVTAAFWMTFAHSATTACRLSLPSPWLSLLPVARFDARRT